MATSPYTTRAGRARSGERPRPRRAGRSCLIQILFLRSDCPTSGSPPLRYCGTPIGTYTSLQAAVPRGGGRGGAEQGAGRIRLQAGLGNNVACTCCAEQASGCTYLWAPTGTGGGEAPGDSAPGAGGGYNPPGNATPETSHKQSSSRFPGDKGPRRSRSLAHTDTRSFPALPGTLPRWR